jgi:hypothetical protein
MMLHTARRLFTSTRSGQREPLQATSSPTMAANAKANTASPRSPIMKVTCKPVIPGGVLLTTLPLIALRNMRKARAELGEVCNRLQTIRHSSNDRNRSLLSAQYRPKSESPAKSQGAQVKWRVRLPVLQAGLRVSI